MKKIEELQLQTVVFSAEQDDVKQGIIESAIDLGCHSAYQLDKGRGMVEQFSISDYNATNQLTKKALLGFACKMSGMGELKTKSDVMKAFSNPMFLSVFNSIQTEAIAGIIVKAQSPQLLAMANIETVDYGDSYTWEIEAKGLPVAQRASRMSNVTIDQTAGVKSLTITPQEYSMGVTMDFSRIIYNDYDFGKQIAKVALGMLYAQQKLISGLIFDTNKTPLYQATFDQLKYVSMAETIKAVNGGAEVVAYATKVALNKLGATIATNGFLLKDELIKEGYIGSPFGIPTVIIDQATDFSAPFVNGELASKLAEDDRIILISGVGDKPVKLVRENYIRITQQNNTSGATNKLRYSYYMAFDAGIVTQQHYGIQAV